MRKCKFSQFGGGKIALTILLCISLFFNLYLCKKEGYWNSILVRVHVRDAKKELPTDYWSVRGWSSCLKKMRIKCDVCFFGHSQIEMSDFQKDFPSKKIVELGYPGDNLDGMIRRVKQIRYVGPKKIFLLAGTNSIDYEKNDFEEKYKKLVSLIRKDNPKCRLYILSILPQREGSLGKAANNSIIKERNSFISNFCKRERITFIDIYFLCASKNGELLQKYTKDGVHINNECYNLIANNIRVFI